MEEAGGCVDVVCLDLVILGLEIGRRFPGPRHPLVMRLRVRGIVGIISTFVPGVADGMRWEWVKNHLGR